MGGVALRGGSGEMRSAEERKDNAEARSSQRRTGEEGTMYRAPTGEKAGLGDFFGFEGLGGGVEG